MTEIIDNTNKLSTDPHDLGEFKNVYDAMKKYPNGGRTGDYITILSVKHYWNEENLSWGILEDFDGNIIQMIEDMLNKLAAEGYAANWVVFVFKQSEEKPATPTGVEKYPVGWLAQTGSGDNWWMSTGIIQGSTGEVISWSEPVRFTGKPANDGVFVFKRSDTQPETPITTNILPDGWETGPTDSNGMWWMSKGDYSGVKKAVIKWSVPVRVTGLDGNVPTWYVLVFKQSATQPSIPTGISTKPQGWVDNPTSEGVWWVSMGTVNGNTNNVISWSTPVKFTGSDGKDGQDGGQGPIGPTGPPGPEGTPGVNGAKGQVVYPAGIYSNSVSYTTDTNKAPYVLDSTNNTYYVLNKQMTWLGTSQGNKTPYQDYSTNGGNASWIPFTGFEAVYTKLLMAQNGLIGSAVFNGDYMFSQQGVDANGNLVYNYQDFGTPNFTPNFQVNLATGTGHFAAGNLTFTNTGGIISKSQISYTYRFVYNEYEHPSSDFPINLRLGTNLNITYAFSDIPPSMILPKASSFPDATLSFECSLIGRLANHLRIKAQSDENIYGVSMDSIGNRIELVAEETATDIYYCKLQSYLFNNSYIWRFIEIPDILTWQSV